VREAVTAAAGEGMSLAAIGRALGITRQRVRAMLDEA
jgi:DNA-directed RNA polymerase sigma subunit (sigma70/sigma32)